jgi:hypothetical protein
MEEKNISEEESLQIITQMIAKAKHNFHENGTSAILWGSVVAVCGLVSFAEMNWDISIGFDIWLLTFGAILPQVFLSIREQRQRRVLSHTEAAMNAIWIVYGISIFALVFYFNTVPHTTDRLLAEEGRHFLEVKPDGSTVPFHLFVPSPGSLLLLLYAIPTMATGIAHKFRPMLVAAVLCYAFFIISCFVSTSYDMLLNGLAGIFNWLIPGLILRRRYNLQKKAGHV